MAKIRNYGVNDIEAWKFNDVGIPQEWRDHLGDVAEGFRMIVQGNSGHGKTEYIMQLSKMLAIHYGKVNLNNCEQGRSKTLQASFIRNKMKDIPPGKWTLADKSQVVFDTWFKRLSGRNTGRVIILDSLDYMKLTVDQFKKLHEKFKKKGIIIVCWDKPFDVNSQKIKFMCDIKVKVHNFRAKIVSRYGGNKTFVIWKNPHKVDFDAKTIELPESNDKIRIEPYADYKVLIVEDQPRQLDVKQALELLERYPDVKEIHELHEVWGGRWSREGIAQILAEENAS